ncbi:Auxin-responsive protein SAUR32 [Linum perenne]
MDCKKSNKITEIVRLQQILKKWRKLANSSKPPTSASSSSITANNTNGSSGSKSIKFLKRTLSLSESSGAAAGRVPKGFLAVSVGEEQKRFTIPTEYLSHPAFHILLREAEEEFGFQQAGVLRIPCEVAVFESVLRIVEEKKDVVYFMQDCKFNVEDGVGGYGYCSLTGQQTPTHHPQSPMCR